MTEKKLGYCKSVIVFKIIIIFVVAVVIVVVVFYCFSGQFVAVFIDLVLFIFRRLFIIYFDNIVRRATLFAYFL